MDHPVSQWLGNVISGAAIVASFVGYIPGIAACVALVWYFIQIYESATIQRWLAGRRIRKLARLKARVIMLEAINHRPLLPGNTGPDDSGMPMKPLD